ncbi:hypothetical protein AVEN_80897-1 [Araneus ventricosus]|uniref:Uncharacterized protein n=1 Tax=Araneus ventricosus TaxID=182803 RepID=A0A4Y2DLC6_ARAVE|nr:hypothetical protein AVEN_80897-1 [Araneus ventricosus]
MLQPSHQPSGHWNKVPLQCKVVSQYSLRLFVGFGSPWKDGRNCIPLCRKGPALGIETPEVRRDQGQRNPVLRRERLEEDRHIRAAFRANETTEQRGNRLRIVQTRELLRQSNLKLEAFKYDPQYDYQVHPNVYIEKMDIVCAL